MEHLKCPNYKDCPYYNKDWKICNLLGGIWGNKTAKCWNLYYRYKNINQTRKLNSIKEKPNQ